MKVDIVSKKMVKPSGPSPNRLERLEITCIDRLLYEAYSGVFIFYKGTGENRERALSEGVDHLEKSLSEVLTLFYPLAGRYAGEDFSMDCNDEGVEFIVAKVDATLDELLHEKLNPEVTQGLSVRRYDLAGKAPLVSIQVNVFECGGLAIGLGIAHIIADGHSMSTFVNSWAAASRINIHGVTTHPDFDLLARFRFTEVGAPPLAIVKERFVTDRFEFDVEKLRNEFGASRVVMVSALICMGLLNGVDRVRYGQSEWTFSAFHAMNLRGRTTASPVGPNYFGNMISLSSSRWRVTAETTLELSAMVDPMRSGLKEAFRKYAEVADDKELCSMIRDSIKELGESFQNGGAYLLISSWCGFPFHETNFGWGKPEQICPTSTPFRSAILIDGKSDKRIDAYISLTEDDMVLFKQDPNITTFSKF